MNRLKIILTLPLLCLTLMTMAQESTKSLSKNTVFLEAGGNGFFYSLNYDRILNDNENWKLAGRAGLMYLYFFRNDQRQMIGVPLEFSCLRGKDKNYLEIGFGLTPVYDTYNLSPWPAIHDFILISALRIGYRYQKNDGGLFFKSWIDPIRRSCF